jgi:hypothetical protein
VLLSSRLDFEFSESREWAYVTCFCVFSGYFVYFHGIWHQVGAEKGYIE